MFGGFLSLFAGNTQTGVRNRFQPFRRNISAAFLAFAVSLVLNSAQGLIDMIKIALALGGQHKSLLALALVGALVGHVKGMAGQFTGGFLHSIRFYRGGNSLDLRKNLLPFFKQKFFKLLQVSGTHPKSPVS